MNLYTTQRGTIIMTKIKNTKKGMAKKTLSMSLVVAMLATSNVPVWAAEFSDGSDDVAVATEADTFTADESEAPVVEDSTEADVAQKNATLDTDIKIASSITWGSEAQLVTGTYLKDSSGKVVTTFKYQILVDGKQPVGDNGTGWDYEFDATSANDLINARYNFNSANFVGHTVTVRIIGTGEFEGLDYTTAGVKVSAKKITDATTAININKAVDYTGEAKTFDVANLSVDNKTSGYGLTVNDFTYSYEGDNVNASEGKSADKQPLLVATVNKTGYEGTIKVPFTIWKHVVIASDYEAKLNTKEYAYTGASITPDSKSVTVTSKLTKETINPDLYTVSVASGSTLLNAGDEGTLKVTFKSDLLAKDKTFSSNYKFADGTTEVDVATKADDTAKIVARNLSDCSISIDSTKYTANLGSTNKDTVKAAVRSLIHIKVGDTELTPAILNGVDYTVSAIDENTKTATVTFTGDDKNVKGTATATFNITLNDIKDATFTGGTDNVISGNVFESEVYTGEAITKNAAQLGKLKVTGAGGKEVTLVEGRDYKVVYSNNNVNVTSATNPVTITVEGIGDWGGKATVGTFAIIPATVKETDVTVPKTVEYNGANVTASDYLDGKVTVKATTKVRNDKGVQVDKTIDIPASAYELSYAASVTPILPGTKLSTTVKVKDANFKNVETVTLTDKTEVVNKDFAADSVNVEVVGGPYTYTGKEIIPTLKVTHNGEELALDRDYTVASALNNVDAGEATLTLKGKGDYTGTKTVKFTIGKANINDITVAAKTSAKAHFTYTGSQVRPGTSDFNITLNGVDVSSQFTFAYPTSSYNNVDAGKASITLVPLKNNKNFAGQKTVDFEILPKELNSTILDGKFVAWDKDNKAVIWNNNYFKYDGTEKTFNDLKFIASTATYNGMKLVEGKDYEVKYFNNITGPEAYVYVVGIGNYASSTKFAGSDTTYTAREKFGITGVTITKDDVTVKDSVYAGGLSVKPNATITVGSKTLVEGTDYEWVIDSKYDTVNVTPSDKVLKATLKAKGGYTRDANFDGIISWKIVAQDLANTNVVATDANGKVSVTVMNGSVKVPETEYDVKDNGDGTVTVSAKTSSKNYTGSQTVTLKDAEKVGVPMISDVKVVGNKATVILSGEVDGAAGYDYVISTDRDCITNKDYDAVNKNQVKTNTTFEYVGQGTYYAYCHAWKRDANGKKVFGEWSNAYPFSVSAITPSQPVITSVKVSGSTVTVTYTKASNADGYDVVLGTSTKKVNGETRPVEYGTLVKKNIKGNVVTATFKNVKKGTYYAGLHAFNRTSEDGKKVFSQWSNVKKVTVK